jgi:exopolyphosphatase/guanosine-5'-triphosphate,3'-diphosphate pyrophosphatase
VPTDDERAQVEHLLGRPPLGAFEIVVRDAAGLPVVIMNHPLLDDGRPMPTRYWLVGADLRSRVGTLESTGGVRAAEAAVDAAALAAAHDRYASERERAIPADHEGPRPSGGVGGTRQGVKCLHAHYAWHLAGGDDPVGRWVEEQLQAHGPTGVVGSPEKSVDTTVPELVAAVDCGTNSTRLLIGDGTTTVERLMRITRLGEGVDATGRLAPQAIARVVAVLEEFRQVLDRHGVTRVRATATSAARDAVNRDEFFDAAEAALGVRPELLPGLEEGRLSFAGATADLDPADGPFLVLDIGGGSTEFVVGTDEAEGVLSCDIGCVRLTEQWIEHDPPLPEELAACLSIVEGHIDDVRREIPSVSEVRTLVGLAGTVSCVAAVELGLAEYDRDLIHHFRLTREAVEDVFRTLVTENREQRLENPGMEEARTDVIVGGLCVLVKVMRQLGFDECLVSEADILDGLVAAQVGDPPAAGRA